MKHGLVLPKGAVRFYGLFGRVLFGMVHRCLTPNSCDGARTTASKCHTVCIMQVCRLGLPGWGPHATWRIPYFCRAHVIRLTHHVQTAAVCKYVFVMPCGRGCRRALQECLKLYVPPTEYESVPQGSRKWGCYGHSQGASVRRRTPPPLQPPPARPQNSCILGQTPSRLRLLSLPVGLLYSVCATTYRMGCLRRIQANRSWEAYGRGSLPLHYLVSVSANPPYVSDPLPQPMWDRHSTGQL